MKLSVVLLVGSLAVNATLIASWSLRSTSIFSSGSSVKTTGALESGSLNSTVPGGGKTRATASGDLVSAWAKLQSKDLRTLVAQLRLAGFSEAMIRGIITARVNEQFADRRKELIAAQDHPYWTGRNILGMFRYADMQKLDREQSDLIKQLVGSAGTNENVFAQIMGRQTYGDMPLEKAEAMQRISRDYSELRNEIYLSANGVMLPEDRIKLDYLTKENRADVEKLLSPEELKQYDLRSSPGASFVRSKLGMFDVTEDEFKALYASQQAFDAKARSTGSGVPGEDRTSAHDRETALLNEAKTIFTPERLAEFHLQSDPQYAMASRLAVRLQLPSSAVGDLVSVQKDIQQQATAVRVDSSLTADQRMSKLTALAQEAETKVSTVFGGPRGLEAYKQYGGQWLKTLSRSAPAAGVR